MKSKFKKSVSLILIIIMCFGFVSCSDSQISQSAKSTQSLQTDISQTQQASEDSAKKSEKEKDSLKSTEKSEEKTESTKNGEKSEEPQSRKGKTSGKKNTAKAATSSTKRRKNNPDEKTRPTSSRKVSTTSAAENICYLTIECKSILNNMKKLKPGHSSYVPKDGYILKNYSCIVKSGDTVYDILLRGCRQNKIKLTAEKSLYGIYVSGINNIDEKDCGSESGWMYSVNKVKPGVSCDKKNVNQNDKIEFTYVCEYI